MVVLDYRSVAQCHWLLMFRAESVLTRRARSRRMAAGYKAGAKGGSPIGSMHFKKTRDQSAEAKKPSAGDPEPPAAERNTSPSAVTTE